MKVVFYNVENLFLDLSKLKSNDFSQMSEGQWQAVRSSLTPNKPLKKTIELRNIILKTDPDILLMCEVGGRESLENFNQFFLEKKYDVYTDNSNSKRGIDLGILVKSNLKFKLKLENFKTYLNKNNELKEFNRNVLKLHIKEKKLSFFLVHLKSKLDKDKKDFLGLEARTNEVYGLYQILQKTKEDFILAGDFNGIASSYDTDEEFKKLHQLDLIDSFDLANMPIEKRWTHHFFNGAFRRSSQIDYLFIKKSLTHKFLRAEKIEYEDTHGLLIDPPKTLEEKLVYPSDHNPIMVELNYE